MGFCGGRERARFLREGALGVVTGSRGDGAVEVAASVRAAVEAVLGSAPGSASDRVALRLRAHKCS